MTTTTKVHWWCAVALFVGSGSEVWTDFEMCEYWGRHAVRTLGQTCCADTEADVQTCCADTEADILCGHWGRHALWLLEKVCSQCQVDFSCYKLHDGDCSIGNVTGKMCVFLCIKMNILKLVAAFIQLFLSKYYEKKSTLSPNEVTGMELEIIALAWNHLFIVLVLFLFFIHCFVFVFDLMQCRTKLSAWGVFNIPEHNWQVSWF